MMKGGAADDTSVVKEGQLRQAIEENRRIRKIRKIRSYLKKLYLTILAYT
jgi:hypothetical protein